METCVRCASKKNITAFEVPSKSNSVIATITDRAVPLLLLYCTITITITITITVTVLYEIAVSIQLPQKIYLSFFLPSYSTVTVTVTVTTPSPFYPAIAFCLLRSTTKEEQCKTNRQQGIYKPL